MKSGKILLLHGALGNKNQLELLKKYLQSSFEVYDLNFEGHSGISTDNEFSMEVFVQNVYDFLKEKSIKKVHVFGYSMGGYVALCTAVKYPQLLDKIVTLGTKFDWSAETAKKEVRMLNPEKITEKVPAYAKKLMTMHGNTNWKTVLHKTANMMLGLANGKKIEVDQLKKITNPVLINIGSRDHMVSIEESTQVCEMLPNGSLNIVKDFEHPIEKNDTQQLATIVQNFIAKK